MSENIMTGAMNAGGAVVVKRTSVSGDIRKAGGGSPVVQASWGQITGNIENQTDLAEALAAKADAADLANYATTEQLAEKADASALDDYATDAELADVSAAVSTKLTTPSGTEGQFMVYRNGAWVGETMATWQGGDF